MNNLHVISRTKYYTQLDLAWLWWFTLGAEEEHITKCSEGTIWFKSGNEWFCKSDDSDEYLFSKWIEAKKPAPNWELVTNE